MRTYLSSVDMAVTNNPVISYSALKALGALGALCHLNFRSRGEVYLRRLIDYIVGEGNSHLLLLPPAWPYNDQLPYHYGHSRPCRYRAYCRYKFVIIAWDYANMILQDDTPQIGFVRRA